MYIHQFKQIVLVNDLHQDEVQFNIPPIQYKDVYIKMRLMSYIYLYNKNAIHILYIYVKIEYH